jgi:hypothetical protein
MDAPFYLRPWDVLATACCFLDDIIVWSIGADAAFQSLERFAWKEIKDRLKDRAWNPKFQLSASQWKAKRPRP